MTWTREKISPLDVDVAISRVSLAAARLQAEIKPTADELTLAKELREYLAQYLENQNADKSVPEEVVPEAKARQLLERSIERFTSVHRQIRNIDAPAMSKLVSALDDFSTQQSFSQEDAEDLFKSLGDLTRSRSELARKLADLPKL